MVRPLPEMSVVDEISYFEISLTTLLEIVKLKQKTWFEIENLQIECNIFYS
jgi:hypothetical protein